MDSQCDKLWTVTLELLVDCGLTPSLSPPPLQISKVKPRGDTYGNYRTAVSTSGMVSYSCHGRGCLGGMSRLNQHELVLQGFEAAGIRDAVYLACAISSGIREFELMIALNLFDREAVRADHQEQWHRQVLQPNIADARHVASRMRASWHGPIIDPSYFDVPEFSQDDYDTLCRAVIEQHVHALALAPGWQFSRGARREVRLALGIGLPLLKANGERWRTDDLCRVSADADATLESMGVFADRGRNRLLPALQANDSGHI